jgi:hypothetical protein
MSNYFFLWVGLGAGLLILINACLSPSDDLRKKSFAIFSYNLIANYSV